MASASDGSSTSIFWKRRDNARSRSKHCFTSAKVVEPMQRSAPEARAGLSRLPASMVPPEAEPAPTSVWISSMNRMAPDCSSSAVSTCLTRSSKSPR